MQDYDFESFLATKVRYLKAKHVDRVTLHRRIRCSTIIENQVWSTYLGFYAHGGAGAPLKWLPWNEMGVGHDSSSSYVLVYGEKRYFYVSLKLGVFDLRNPDAMEPFPLPTPYFPQTEVGSQLAVSVFRLAFQYVSYRDWNVLALTCKSSSDFFYGRSSPFHQLWVMLSSLIYPKWRATLPTATASRKRKALNDNPPKRTKVLPWIAISELLGPNSIVKTLNMHKKSGFVKQLFPQAIEGFRIKEDFYHPTTVLQIMEGQRLRTMRNEDLQSLIHKITTKLFREYLDKEVPGGL